MSEFLRKLKWLAQRRQRDEELRAELEFHLAEETEEGKAAGLSELQAPFAAQGDLGNGTLLAEETRARWGWPILEQFISDAMFAWRTLLRAPSFTTAAVLTLAL